jgi:hypothetical protein
VVGVDQPPLPEGNSHKETISMRILQLLAVVVIAGALSPLTAKKGTTKLDLGGYGGVIDGVKVFVCDTESDHKGVRVRHLLKNGEKGKVGDANGSEPPCERGRTVTTRANPIIW